MPIVPCFDPSTGASGGPSGGGGGGGMRLLGDLSDPSFTFTDTAGVALNSYSFDGSTGIHTFDTNNIAVGNADYTLTSGANFLGPKWTIPMTYGDGSPVQAGDAFSVDLRFTDVDPDTARQYYVAVAAIQNPTSTVTGTMRPSGIYCLTTSVGTPGVGCVEDNIGAAATTTAMISGSGGFICGGAPAKIKAGGSCVAIGAATGQANTRIGGNSWNVADNTQLSMGIFLCTNGTGTSTGGLFKMRINYVITKLS